MLFEVAIRTPLRKLFTYASDIPLERGVRVRVPFRSREVTGFVWNKTDVKPRGLKRISRVLDESPFFESRTLEFYERSASYYGVSLGELLSASIPKKVQEGKKFEVDAPKHFVSALAELSPQQNDIFEKICSSSGFTTHLLFGETGSGKTEIYLHLIDRILERSGQILLMVPEISLTPQLEDRLSKRLGARVSTFHSQQTEKKREDAYARAWDGQPDVFLGARSALFLPFRSLQLIIVDEEHDGSFKQSERAPYNARDLALLRGQIFQTPVVLGSATPSLESWHRTQEQKAPLYKLQPYFPKPKPLMTIVDLKKIWKTGDRSFISPSLQEALQENLERREQSLLFLNRRGSASQRLCLSCGLPDECPHCSVTLTIHNDLRRGICHWCGYQRPLQDCESCGGKDFFVGGIGTKEIEIQVKERFPEARVERLDRDQTLRRQKLPQILRAFASGEIDILIGTQMISKGIDISNLSLIGVILADQGWGVPDFRATERSFQLLHQLVGRAGRRGQESKAVLQTMMPDHPLFQWLQSDSPYEDFQSAELPIRQMAALPPYSKLCLLTLMHRKEDICMKEGEIIAKRAKLIGKPLSLEIHGPVFAPVKRWKNLYRIHILVKALPKTAFTSFIQALLDDMESYALSSKIRLDRDPYQFL